jgi:hypothetical protein
VPQHEFRLYTIDDFVIYQDATTMRIGSFRWLNIFLDIHSREQTGTATKTGIW